MGLTMCAGHCKRYRIFMRVRQRNATESMTSTATLFLPGAFTTGMRIGGVVALAVGAAHFLLPTLGYDQELLQSVPKVPRDHFVYLGTYAIGIFLVIAGVMSLFFAQLHGGTGARLFAGAQAAFWAARIDESSSISLLL
jgi:hypothetical protein